MDLTGQGAPSELTVKPPAPQARARWLARLIGPLLVAFVLAWIAVYVAAVAEDLRGPLGGGPVLGGGVAAASGAPSQSPATGSPEATAGNGPAGSPRATQSSSPGAGSTAGATVTDRHRPLEFGMSGHLMWRDVGTAIKQLDMLRDDGLAVVRFDVSWRGLEPRPGHYAWLDKLDRIVDAAVARHIRPVVTILETPAWANGGRSAWVPPADPNDYAAFTAMLAKRYAGRVDAWEIWNEPDIPLFWQPAPDAAAYGRLLSAASAAIRKANPDATVVGGSVTFGNVEFVKTLYALGLKGTFDVLSVHPYTLTRAPGDERDRYHSLTAILDDVRSVMVAEGDTATPVWVTELGWAVTGVNSVSPDRRVTYLTESVRLIRERPWVEVVTMYTIDTADSARYGLSTAGRRSAAWGAYVSAVAKRP